MECKSWGKCHDYIFMLCLINRASVWWWGALGHWCMSPCSSIATGGGTAGATMRHVSGPSQSSLEPFQMMATRRHSPNPMVSPAHCHQYPEWLQWWVGGGALIQCIAAPAVLTVLTPVAMPLSPYAPWIIHSEGSDNSDLLTVYILCWDNKVMEHNSGLFH